MSSVPVPQSPPPGYYSVPQSPPPPGAYASAQRTAPRNPAPGTNPGVVRGVRPDDRDVTPARTTERTVSLSLPPPEQLGLGSKPPPLAEPTPPNSSPPAEVDWNSVHRQLRDLGVLSSQIERIAGGFRFTYFLPSTSVAGPRRVVGEGTTEAEAVGKALAESGSSGKIK